MTTFNTNPGVNVFETVGPNGTIRIEAGTPYSTKDSREVGLLESYGAHALTKSAGSAPKAEKKIEKGGDES
jgi:hypothetical protein